MSDAMALFQPGRLAADGKVYLRVGDKWHDVSSSVSKAEFVSDVGGANTLTITIPFAMMGTPPDAPKKVEAAVAKRIVPASA